MNEHAAIHLTMPPPSDEQLQARLQRLQAPALPPADEADLLRRFQRLQGQHVSTAAEPAAAAAFAAPPQRAEPSVRLAGLASASDPSDEVDALLQQMHEHTRLEQEAETGSSAPLPALASRSPPLPSRSEVDALLRDLQSLPDATLLPSHKQRPRRHSASDSDGDSSMDEGDSDDEDAAAVRSVVRMAQDEARLERGAAAAAAVAATSNGTAHSSARGPQ